jgi:hypothetical protein
MELVARFGWGPLQIDPFVESGKRAATRFVERLSFPHDRLEAISQKRTDRPAFFGRHDTYLPKQIGVEL